MNHDFPDQKIGFVPSQELFREVIMEVLGLLCDDVDALWEDDAFFLTVEVCSQLFVSPFHALFL